jgi:acyl-CoA synthetase (AMP-forming)/AMP-acid ligase II
MRIEKLLQNFADWDASECLVAQGVSYHYGDMQECYEHWHQELAQRDIPSGAVVGLRTDYSFDAIGLFLALLAQHCIVALIPSSVIDEQGYLTEGEIESWFHFHDDGSWEWKSCGRDAGHKLIQQLRQENSSGFLLFSSGSTGKPKAVLHSLERFLSKYDTPGKPLRTLGFLLFDHVAGIDTLFYTLSCGGVLVLTNRRDPLTVCMLIQEHRVEVLPASPTFLHFLCISGVHENFDLSSLRIITYGSEPMNQTTLDRLATLFPQVRIIQKYGTSEFGSPRALSQGNDSLWFKLKTDELAAKVIDSILWVKTETAMLGYLNAPSPFDDHGWLCTGDLVEQSGEWIRICGRQSDLINVGGEKVYPQEVENALLELDFIQDVIVKGESHPLTGQIVTAKINLCTVLDEKTVCKKIRQHCRKQLAPYKLPVKIEIISEALSTTRQKKFRS